MRFQLSSALVALSLVAPIFAAPAPADDAGEASAAVENAEPEYTTFNGMQVPPIKELTGEK